MSNAIHLDTPSPNQVAEFAPYLPALVQGTGPVSYSYQFGSDGLLLAHLVQASWRTPGTLFAAATSLVAVDDGQPAGIAIAFDGPDFYRFKAALGALGRELVASGQISADDLKGLAHRAGIASYLNPHISSGSFYLHVLSIRPELRGRGLGARLLERTVARARAARCSELQLDVLSDNPAVQFYEAQGLRILVETKSPFLSREYGFPSELRMAMAI
jgi:ribosomal protein S18 acetylase RimI-like enzyme